jgi:hypothetical protein
MKKPPFSTVLTPTTSQHLVVHRVECDREGRYHEHHASKTDYFDVPKLLAGTNRQTCLQGQHRLMDIENYLEDRTDISFDVCLTYSCTAFHETVKDIFKRLPMPEMSQEVAY